MSNGAARRAVEVIAAAAFIVAIFVWPHTRVGWIIQIFSIGLFLACVSFLRKWPSS